MLVRSPLLISHKWRELVSSGRFVCRCHDTFSLMLHLFCFASFSRPYAFVEAAALRSIVLRYAGVPIATRVSFFLFFPFFVYLEMSLFPSFFCTISAFSLCGEYVVRSFLPDGVFLSCDLPSLPGSRLTIFLSRCKFSTLKNRQPMMVDFYLLTFPRFPLRKKEHKSYFGKNRTHDFRTSRCAGYLLDHSGDSIGTFNMATLYQ